jgi:hypothetical protein
MTNEPTTSHVEQPAADDEPVSVGAAARRALESSGGWVGTTGSCLTCKPVWRSGKPE